MSVLFYNNQCSLAFYSIILEFSSYVLPSLNLSFIYSEAGDFSSIDLIHWLWLET